MKYSSVENSKKLCIPVKFTGIHYINFTLLTFILLFSAHMVLGAEGISVPLENLPVITGKTGAASEISEPYLLQRQFMRETGEGAQKTITKELQKEKEKGQSPFVQNLFKMFEVLFSVLILICGLSGAILFYKWLKNKTILVKTQQQAAQVSFESKEPATVSEAVASFVKHRIKK